MLELTSAEIKCKKYAFFPSFFIAQRGEYAALVMCNLGHSL